jgi:hypothetical protein
MHRDVGLNKKGKEIEREREREKELENWRRFRAESGTKIKL